MKTQTFTFGPFATNCYVVWCEKTNETIIIDPGSDNELEAESLFRFVNENSLKPKFIVNTHGHPDHTCGNKIAKETFHVPILIHELDAHMLGQAGKTIAEFFGFMSYSPDADKLLRDGDTAEFGNETLRVIHTPGHSHGSISLLGEQEIFTGDTLFAGSIGRTDFPESSEGEMQVSLKKLSNLPDNLIVYSGHGPSTVLFEEKRNNPFLTGYP
jgi:glyoxylase-like metal-dependent hydrolase (beta-lactamase superfamily II)